MLFPGAYVAWVDASHVRVMDLVSQTAICHLTAPIGVGIDGDSFTYPCTLYWDKDNELLVGWADLLRIVKICDSSSSSSSSSSSMVGGGAGRGVGGRTTSTSTLSSNTISSSVAPGTTIIAKTCAEWYTDSIICGVFPFDRDHVAVLGYNPPDERDMDMDADANIDKNLNIIPTTGSGSTGAESNRPFVDATNRPELLVYHRETGDLVSADTLPLSGLNMQGPHGYTFLSSYECGGADGEDSRRWDLNNYRYRSNK